MTVRISICTVVVMSEPSFWDKVIFLQRLTNVCHVSFSSALRSCSVSYLVKAKIESFKNMTVLVLLVILYHATFYFARGARKNILILTEKSGRFNAMLQDNTAPAKWRIAPLLNNFC